MLVGMKPEHIDSEGLPGPLPCCQETAVTSLLEQIFSTKEPMFSLSETHLSKKSTN
ncbi:hypothetical protein Fmac_029134 [Flemingia macrophylla]|uniref:Uncharacterized protein n=1 Tax=Flemingia macrophylla TaxID=520843 RepID=A0ABD1LAX9_9FABA